MKIKTADWLACKCFDLRKSRYGMRKFLEKDTLLDYLNGTFSRRKLKKSVGDKNDETFRKVLAELDGQEPEINEDDLSIINVEVLN